MLGVVEIVASVAGVLGFFISLFLFIRDLYRNALSYKISDAVYTSLDAERLQNGVLCISVYIRFCLRNGSHRPVSVTSIDFAPDAEHRFQCYRRKWLYLGFGSKDGNARWWTTTLPINLSPQESRDILVFFPVPVELVQSLHLPKDDTLEGYPHTRTPVKQEDHKADSDDQRTLEFDLYLYGGRRVRIPVRARLGYVADDVKPLEHAAALGGDD